MRNFVPVKPVLNTWLMGMRATLKVIAQGPTWPKPMQAAVHHKPTLLGHLAMERWVFFSRSVDDRLKSVAQLRAASMVGCLW